MKKSMLFKSLFAGTLALSTFSAHAGIFNLGRTIFAATAASSAAGAYQGCTKSSWTEQQFKKYSQAAEMKPVHRAFGAIELGIGCLASYSSQAILRKNFHDCRLNLKKIAHLPQWHRFLRVSLFSLKRTIGGIAMGVGLALSHHGSMQLTKYWE